MKENRMKVAITVIELGYRQTDHRMPDWWFYIQRYVVFNIYRENMRIDLLNYYSNNKIIIRIKL